jgi:hypothetical protein
MTRSASRETASSNAASTDAAPSPSSDPDGATLEALRQRLAELERLEADLEQTVRAFRLRYREELAPLVEELLKARRALARRRMRRGRATPRRRARHREARRDLEAFRKARRAADPDAKAPEAGTADDSEAGRSGRHAGAGASDGVRPGPEGSAARSTGPSDGDAELSSEAEQQLKDVYREASKRCHPDAVDPEKREAATETFHALQAAYESRNLDRVRRIARRLEAHGVGGPEAGSADARRDAERRLRRRVEAVRSSIEALRDTDAFRAVQDARSVDRYVERRARELRRQIRILRSR